MKTMWMKYACCMIICGLFNSLSVYADNKPSNIEPDSQEGSSDKLSGIDYLKKLNCFRNKSQDDILGTTSVTVDGSVVSPQDVINFCVLKQLESISLSKLQLDEEILTQILELKSLRAIELISCQVDEHKKTLAKSGINSLAIRYTRMSPSTLKSLLGIPGLRTVDISRGPGSIEELLTMLGKVSNLKEMTIDQHISKTGAELLGKFEKLIRVKLKIWKGSEDAVFEALGKIKGLKDLDITSGVQITSEMISNLEGMNDLENLTIRCADNTPLDARSIAIIGGLKNLENLWIPSLIIKDGKLTNLGCAKSSGRSLDFLKYFKQIKSVEIGIPSNDKLNIFKDVGQLADLEFLSMDFSGTMTSDMTAHLSGLNKLKTLILHSGSHCPLDKATMANIGKIKNLENLGLGYFQIDFGGLRTLENLPLKRLDLRSNKQVDHLFIRLAATAFPELRALNLRYCPNIRNHCLPSFAKMKNLKIINIFSTKISEGEMKQACPGVTLSMSREPFMEDDL